MINLSAVIIAFNEEKNIKRCLKSLEGIADEIIVVDSFSSDRTEEICKEKGAKVYQREFKGYSDQKNYGVDQAKYDYIISLDADEALSDKLKASILAIKENWEKDAYFFSRITNYCGKWISHSGWYPDFQLRIWDRRKGKWNNSKIHERIELSSESEKERIKGDLLHYSFYSVEQHLKQIDKFANLKAEVLMQKGKKPSVFKMYSGPLIRFLSHYIFKLGFLDGYYGFVISKYSAYAAFLKYSKLKELYAKGK